MYDEDNYPCEDFYTGPDYEVWEEEQVFQDREGVEDGAMGDYEPSETEIEDACAEFNHDVEIENIAEDRAYYDRNPNEDYAGW